MLDSIYGQVMRVRRRRYERQPELQRRLSRPVISVGNLSLGGTGKSPVCAALASYLTVLRENPAILSRGYKREDPVDGVVSVSAVNLDGSFPLKRAQFAAKLAQVGDEPMMLARASSSTVFVSPERYLAGRLAESRGFTVHLLDDGFQHLQLARDLDILVTRIGEIPNGRVIPFGRLREPADAAARADLLIVSDANAQEAAAEASLLGISRSCGMTRLLSGPICLQDRWTAAPPRDAKILAVAGIAHPERFVVSLQQAGWNVVDLVSFPDHHRYAASDLRQIAARVASCGADAVYTTAKDSVRFEAIEPAPFPLYRVNLLVNFDPAHLPYDAVKAVLQ